MRGEGAAGQAPSGSVAEWVGGVCDLVKEVGWGGSQAPPRHCADWGAKVAVGGPSPTQVYTCVEVVVQGSPPGTVWLRG